jgi:hypothetical protein
MDEDFTEEEWREFSTALLRHVLRGMPLNRLTHAAQSGDVAFRQVLKDELTKEVGTGAVLARRLINEVRRSADIPHLMTWLLADEGRRRAAAPWEVLLREATEAFGKNTICRLAGVPESWETVDRWLANPKAEVLPERSVQAIRYAYRILHLFERDATREEGIGWITVHAQVVLLRSSPKDALEAATTLMRERRDAGPHGEPLDKRPE